MENNRFPHGYQTYTSLCVHGMRSFVHYPVTICYYLGYTDTLGIITISAGSEDAIISLVHTALH